MKGWLLEVLIKKFGPSAIRGGILGLSGLLVAKHELLSPLGIIYDTATNILTINFDHLSMWAMAILPALGAGLIKILNHHVDEAAKPLLKKEAGAIPDAIKK